MLIGCYDINDKYCHEEIDQCLEYYHSYGIKVLDVQKDNYIELHIDSNEWKKLSADIKREENI